MKFVENDNLVEVCFPFTDVLSKFTKFLNILVKLISAVALGIS